MNPDDNILHHGGHCRSLHGFYQQQDIKDVVSSNGDNTCGTNQTVSVNHNQHTNNHDSYQFPFNQSSQMNHGYTVFPDVNGVRATGHKPLANAASDQNHTETIEENPNLEGAEGLMLLTAANQHLMNNSKVDDGNIRNDAGVSDTDHSGSLLSNEVRLHNQSYEPYEKNNSAASEKNVASTLEQQCGINQIKDGKIHSAVADTHVSQVEPKVEAEAIGVVVDVAAENIDATELEEANTDQRPPSTKLAPKDVICLRGTLSRYTDGRIKIVGFWGMDLDVILNDPQNSAAFEYEHERSLEPHSVALQGNYRGWFEIFSASENRKVRCQETDVDLTFIENRDGNYNVKGQGKNAFGKYSISGTLKADGEITMFRRYVANAITNTASNRTLRSREKKKKRSKTESHMPNKKRKMLRSIKHVDSGKRYGIGREGLLCDCCFLREEEEVGNTPFIQCLYCGLVAHSACYPPISTVDGNGKFLCDVCSVQFYPSINKEERNKFCADNYIPAPIPKPLKEDIVAKHDGRLHSEDFYCQCCGRNDVLGGMKPTGYNSWVHLACLMAAGTSYFDGTIAVGVQKSLTENKAELIRLMNETGLKPKCDECGGDSGMLLRCREEGCHLHLHALCAEIVDRLRVVENNGIRDVLSYKCTLHSYEGLDLCGICHVGDKQNEMLECEKCKQGYHMGCLSPPLTEVPEGDWYCCDCSNK